MTYAFADWGPSIGSVDVDWAIINQLKLWLPTYVGQQPADYNVQPADSAKGLQPPTVAQPITYDNVLDMDELTDKQLPGIFVITAKTTKVTGGANWTYEAWWRTQVYSLIRGRNQRESKWLANYLEVEVRRAMLQKVAKTPPTDTSNDQDVELQTASSSIVSQVLWNGSEIQKVPNFGTQTGDGRYLSAGVGTFTVITDKAAQGWGGPNIPNSAPYGPDPTVSAVDTTIELQPSSEDI